MVGLAALAVPLVISTASYFDTAKAAPVSSVAVADIGIKASPGCTVNSPAALDTTVNVILGDRRYLLYFPVNYQPDKPAPLVLSYHGRTRTAESQQALDLLSTPYFNEDYIMVYPNGVDATWQGAPNVTTNDVAFTAAILDELEGQYCIDSNRIYATGKSQGGGLVGVLACDPNMSRRIAAFSPVAGAFYQAGAVCDANAVAIACNPGRSNIPILDFHGLADTTIAYNGGARRGACLPAIPYYCRYWAQQDGLALVNTTSRVPGALPNSTAARYEWGSGDSQGLVTHVMSGIVSGTISSVATIFSAQVLAKSLEQSSPKSISDLKTRPTSTDKAHLPGSRSRLAIHPAQ